MRSDSVRPRRLWRMLAALASGGVLVAIGVAANALTASGGPPPSGPARVNGPIHDFPGAYVRGSGFFREAGSGRTALPESVSSPLSASLAPVAVSSPDGKLVAYDVWRPARALDRLQSLEKQGVRDGDPLGTPVLRLYDTTTGRDRELEKGAYSAAWRADGALAYVRGVDRALKAGADYAGKIVVQATPRGPATEWTTDAARYVVAGWAGSHLIAYRLGLGEQLETLALDGPGKVRVLAGASVVAISPDGASVLLVDDEAVRLVDVASGAETARLDLADVRDPASGTPVGGVSYSGSWRGDHVVAAVDSGLVIFDVGDGRISVEQALGLDPQEFPAGVEQPQLLDDSANRVVAVAEIPPADGAAATNFLVSCDRVTRTCERGDAAPATDWIRPVRDDGRSGKRGH